MINAARARKRVEKAKKNKAKEKREENKNFFKNINERILILSSHGCSAVYLGKGSLMQCSLSEEDIVSTLEKKGYQIDFEETGLYICW